MVLAGKDYGMGSSRDWAAKGTFLLGVRAVIAATYERIHRSNLVMMGVLPLTFPEATMPSTLGLDGTETFEIDVDDDLHPRQDITVRATRADGTVIEFTATAGSTPRSRSSTSATAASSTWCSATWRRSRQEPPGPAERLIGRTEQRSRLMPTNRKALVNVIIAVTVVLIALAVAARSRDTDPHRTLADNGATVPLEEGGTLIIDLKANPSTGYTWEIESIDESVLRLVGEPAYESDADLEGSPGHDDVHVRGDRYG